MIKHGRIKTFSLVYFLERMIYFRINGPKIEFGFIVIYLSFNKFFGASIHLFGILSIHIHRQQTCSFVSFDRMAAFIYLRHMIIKVGITDLQFIQMHMTWMFATMSAKSIKDFRDILCGLTRSHIVLPIS